MHWIFFYIMSYRVVRHIFKFCVPRTSDFILVQKRSTNPSSWFFLRIQFDDIQLVVKFRKCLSMRKNMETISYCVFRHSFVYVTVTKDMFYLKYFKDVFKWARYIQFTSYQQLQFQMFKTTINIAITKLCYSFTKLCGYNILNPIKRRKTLFVHI